MSPRDDRTGVAPADRTGVDPLVIVGLVGAGTFALFGVELARSGGQEPWPTWLFAACFAFASGGLVGWSTHGVRSPLVLTLLLALGPALLWARTVWWTLGRAIDLHLSVTRLWGALFVLAVACGLFFAMRRLARNLPLHAWIAAASALLALPAALWLAHELMVVIGFVVPLVLLAAGTTVLCRTSNAYLPALAAFAPAFVRPYVDPMYVDQRRLLAASALCFVTLAARRSRPGSTSARPPQRARAWFERRGVRRLAAPLALVVAGLATELCLGSFPEIMPTRVHATGLSGALAEGAQAIFDWDRDSVAMALGQRDCAPFDGRRARMLIVMPITVNHGQ
jgi:hypothetical protein